MLNKLRENIYIHRKVKKPLTALIEGLKAHRAQTEVLVICPQVTGGNWLGVNVGTKSLFAHVFTMPQYFSKPVYNKGELEAFAKAISSLGFEQVIFSGFCNYFADIILPLKKSGNVKTGVIFHGALSELAYGSDAFNGLTELFKNGQIDKFGLVKKDLDAFFNRIYNTDKCHHLIYQTAIPPKGQPIANGKVNVGVFAIHNFNKNTFNQVSAGLLVKNAEVHVLMKNSFSFLHSDKIVVHPRMPHNEFKSMLGSMTINTHISFSESWGQIVTESMAAGVPCLTSDNNGIFDFDEYLAEKLIVQQYDNPVSIAKQMEIVISERDKISERGLAYINRLNTISKEKLDNFLQK